MGSSILLRLNKRFAQCKNMPIRNFVFSCSVFGGFTAELNVNEKTTLDKCVDEAVNILKDTLNTFNLYTLVDTLKTKKYHIHDQSMEKILRTNEPIYICICTI